jgi:hypothetical protein
VAELTVLFLAANPEDLDKLEQSREYRETRSAVRASEYRDRIDVIPVPAARFADLNAALNEHRPQVVHFSGHGSASGEISLLTERGLSQAVTPDALSGLFGLHKDHVRMVVLNACYTTEQAQAIAREIECVIGMLGEIDDDAAVAFAAELYGTIGYGKSIWDAFEAAKLRLQVRWQRQDYVPQIIPSDPSALRALNLLRVHKGGAQPPDPSVVHVDRERELGVFGRMIGGDGPEHIFVITAPSGMGKTRLMNEFCKTTQDHEGARICMVRLDAGVEDPIDVLGRLATSLGRGSEFERFNQARREVIAAGPQSARTEKMQLQLLTDAFIADLAAVAQASTGPTVLIFDAFNDPSGVVESWIESHLLSAVARERAINVVVSGHVAPRLEIEGVSTHSEVGKFEPENVREWADRLELQLSKGAIQVIYDLSEGGHPRVLKDYFFKLMSRRMRDG